MSLKCTWKNCEGEAKHPQNSIDGEVWANLCDEHEDKYNEHVLSLDPRRLVGAWVAAQGGAEEAMRDESN